MLRTTITAPYHQLASLTVAVLDHYQARKQPLPEAIVQMQPCIDDALHSDEEPYVELMGALFSIVVEEVMLHEEVRLCDGK